MVAPPLACYSAPGEWTASSRASSAASAATQSPNLILYVVCGMGVVWLLAHHPETLGRLVLDADAVRAGQVWRLVTFLLIPSDTSLWMLVALYFTWWIGSSLEQHWGAFKLNAYYFVGILGTVLAALIAGPQSNTWLNLSLFLAFATVFPDVQILLMFILPIRVKWLGLAAGLWLLYSAAMGGWGVRASVGAAMINYALFFGGHWLGYWRGRNLVVRRRPGATSSRRAAP